jgi:hypothetical protein
MDELEELLSAAALEEEAALGMAAVEEGVLPITAAPAEASPATGLVLPAPANVCTSRFSVEALT